MCHISCIKFKISLHFTVADYSGKMSAAPSSRDNSPGPNRLRNFKNAGKDIEVGPKNYLCTLHLIQLKIVLSMDFVLTWSYNMSFFNW